MASLKPLINGKNYDWGDITFSIFGIPVVMITEINYTRDKDKVLGYGAGQEPVSWGGKNYMYSGDISLYTEEIRNILRTAPNRSILDIPPFTASVLLNGDGVTFATDRLNNVMFTKDPFGVKQNDSSIIVKIPFVFAGLDHIG